MATGAPAKITDWVDPNDKSGEFKRKVSQFRSFIKNDPSAEYPAEKGRYWLYVSYACPWASRTLVFRKLKGLEDIIGYTVVHWHMGPQGWRFVTKEDTDAPGENVVPDPNEGHEGITHIRQLYHAVNPDYAGRYTVPVLYDTKTKTIVNNESSEIIRMMNTEFNDLIEPQYRDIDLYPAHLREQIDAANEWHYDTMNNGVYKAGFATTAEAYQTAVLKVFNGLDRAEKHLSETEGPYWFGKELTEVDVRLYVTIVRFDPVYVQHFKTNLRDIRGGYPHLHKWMRNLYWNHPAFKDTTNFLHIKNHYTQSHTQINPFSITPLGPIPDILPLNEEIPAVAAAIAAYLKK